MYPFQGAKNIILDDSLNEIQKFHNLPQALSIHRFLLTDLISDTLRLFAHNHKEASNFLLRLPDYLYSTRVEDLGYSITEAIVETILLEIMTLPKPELPTVYFHGVMCDIFQQNPKEAPAAVGKCIRTLFSRMDFTHTDSNGNSTTGGLDVECVRRFGWWFSHHLSNFGFIWKWAEWENVVLKGRHTDIQEGDWINFN